MAVFRRAVAWRGVIPGKMRQIESAVMTSTADLKSLHTSGEFDQGLQIGQAVLESIGLPVPMTFLSS
jgi:hypothetical protein